MCRNGVKPETCAFSDCSFYFFGLHFAPKGGLVRTESTITEVRLLLGGSFSFNQSRAACPAHL